jgi:hypothetical protein
MTRRTFRCGTTLWPLLVWSILAGAAAVLILWKAQVLERKDSTGHGLLALSAALLLLGPSAFIAYFLRWSAAPLTVNLEEGITTSRSRILHWREIHNAVHQRGMLPRWLNLGELEDLGSLIGDMMADGILLGLLTLVIGFTFGLILFVVLPVVVLISPWHSRVILQLKDGETRTYRDLQHADEFVATVNQAAAGASPTPSPQGI